MESCLGVTLTVILSGPILNETPTQAATAGIFVVVLGIFLISNKRTCCQPNRAVVGPHTNLDANGGESAPQLNPVFDVNVNDTAETLLPSDAANHRDSATRTTKCASSGVDDSDAESTDYFTDVDDSENTAVLSLACSVTPPSIVPTVTTKRLQRVPKEGYSAATMYIPQQHVDAHVSKG